MYVYDRLLYTCGFRIDVSYIHSAYIYNTLALLLNVSDQRQETEW